MMMMMMLNHLKQKGTQNYAKSSFLRILRLECIDLITKNSRSHIRCVWWHKKPTKWKTIFPCRWQKKSGSDWKENFPSHKTDSSLNRKQRKQQIKKYKWCSRGRLMANLKRIFMLFNIAHSSSSTYHMMINDISLKWVRSMALYALLSIIKNL